MMPRFDLMRNHIDWLRTKHDKNANFLKAVFKSVYGKGYYSSHATNYARTLLNN